MLVVEVDGSQHDLVEQMAHDVKRDAWMKCEGYKVLRFGTGEVRTRISVVLDTIEGALRAAS